jgi:hypothetical protein
MSQVSAMMFATVSKVEAIDEFSCRSAGNPPRHVRPKYRTVRPFHKPLGSAVPIAEADGPFNAGIPAEGPKTLLKGPELAHFHAFP